MITLLVHIANAEAIKLDVEEIPAPTDPVIIGSNPRERNDKDVTWLEDGVTTIMLPWWRINFIEVLPDPDAQADYPLPFRE
ncbi:MAG: hypothetical protein D6737_14675 [Chloroflexi bacterium]|nr:MAG: hypothetical protein D6737_14675 [Chloroflexota bacterium]